MDIPIEVTMQLDVRRLNRILSKLYSDFKDLKDDNRELPMKWSVMHMYSSSHLAVLVGLKNNLNPEILGIIGALHDIGAIKTKKRKNHAKNASKYVYDTIDKYNTLWRGKLPAITKEELQNIHEAVISHSDKSTISNNPYIEAMKDIDSFDRYLHGIKTKGEHLQRLDKSLKLFKIEGEAIVHQ